MFLRPIALISHRAEFMNPYLLDTRKTTAAHVFHNQPSPDKHSKLYYLILYAQMLLLQFGTIS